MTTNGEGFSIQWQETGALEKLVFGDRLYVPAFGRSFFEIDANPASAKAHRDGSGFQLRPADCGGAPRARNAEGRDVGPEAPPSGEMRITSGDEVSLIFEAISVSAAPTAAESAGRAGLSLGFPSDSEIHLAEYCNVGRMLDADMPVGESYEGKLAYGFLVVHVAGMWIRFRVDRHSMNGAEVRIIRLPSMFAVTTRWQPGDPLRIMPFPSLEDATADFASHLESDFGVKKLRDAPNLPQWVEDTRLIFTIDMMRSNWETSHDFADVEKLCGELDRAGCPKNTILYIPGWQGAYDAVHPTYRPAEKLGGEKGFRKMVEAAHRCGYKVMIHTTGWGIDPYHPDIDDLVRLAKKDEKGNYQGWQIGYTRRPPRQDLGFYTDRIAVSASGSDSPHGSTTPLALTTPAAPSWCEALFTVGGLLGYSGRLRLACGRRSIATPEGWLEDHDEYDFPFPLLLEEGENTVELSFLNGSMPESGLWYRIRYSFIPESPYSPWTWPILRADTSHPGYIRAFVQNISSVVKEFDIDAVHVDAISLGWPPEVRKIFYELRDALPGIPINTELYTEFEGLGYWTFSQNAAQSLIAKRRSPEEQQPLPVKCGLPELFSWLDKTSPVCDFAREYIRTYPHLCAVNAFVPVGKVCNTFPPRLVPVKTEEHWRVLRDAGRLGYIPTLRVNFREYGLDEETVKAIKELAG